jgi:hypothetical protein
MKPLISLSLKFLLQCAILLGQPTAASGGLPQVFQVEGKAVHAIEQLAIPKPSSSLTLASNV